MLLAWAHWLLKGARIWLSAIWSLLLLPDFSRPGCGIKANGLVWACFCSWSECTWAGYSAQIRSMPNYCWRFFGEGNTSYVTLIRKLILVASISQISFQVIFLFSTLSHCIHCPCLASEIAFVILFAFFCLCNSSTTSFLCSEIMAVHQVGPLVAWPKPSLSFWTSLCFSADVSLNYLTWCAKKFQVFFKPWWSPLLCFVSLSCFMMKVL